MIDEDRIRKIIREELAMAALVPKPICRLCGQQIGSASEALSKCGSTICPMTQARL
jgi:hypothetical protein